MKKLCLLVIAALLLLSACAMSDEQRRQRALDELNENSGLPFALALPETELGDVGEYLRVEGWGCCRLENEDVCIGFSGYPDLQDPYHITDYRLQTPMYDIFGLRVGDTAGRAAEILKPMGYRPAPKDGWSILYEKDGVFIRLEFEEGKISVLTVFVESTNVEDIVF